MNPEALFLMLIWDVLNIWRLLHPTFPTETIDSYIKSVFNGKIKCAQAYPSLKKNESKINHPPEVCSELREKLIIKYNYCFKNKLEKGDRVNIPPVKLEIDPTRNIGFR